MVDDFDDGSDGDDGAEGESEEGLSVLGGAEDLILPCVDVLVVHVADDRVKVLSGLPQQFINVERGIIHQKGALVGEFRGVSQVEFETLHAGDRLGVIGIRGGGEGECLEVLQIYLIVLILGEEET